MVMDRATRLNWSPAQIRRMPPRGSPSRASPGLAQTVLLSRGRQSPGGPIGWRPKMPSAPRLGFQLPPDSPRAPTLKTHSPKAHGFTVLSLSRVVLFPAAGFARNRLRGAPSRFDQTAPLTAPICWPLNVEWLPLSPSIIQTIFLFKPLYINV